MRIKTWDYLGLALTLSVALTGCGRDDANQKSLQSSNNIPAAHSVESGNKKDLDNLAVSQEDDSNYKITPRNDGVSFDGLLPDRLSRIVGMEASDVPDYLKKFGEVRVIKSTISTVSCEFDGSDTAIAIGMSGNTSGTTLDYMCYREGTYNLKARIISLGFSYPGEAKRNFDRAVDTLTSLLGAARVQDNNQKIYEWTSPRDGFGTIQLHADQNKVAYYIESSVK